MRKEVWGFQENVIVFFDEELIGGPDDFIKWALDTHGYREFRFVIWKYVGIPCVYSVINLLFN